MADSRGPAPFSGDALFRALAHPLRVAILAHMIDRDSASPAEAHRAGVCPDASLGVLAYHFRVLRRLGILRIERTTTNRGAIEHHHVVADRVRGPVGEALLLVSAMRPAVYFSRLEDRPAAGRG